MSRAHKAEGGVPAERKPHSSPAGAELFLPLLCLVGLCTCAYLSVLHYALMLGDLSLGGVCGGGTWGDCNSVVASRYGKLLGLPVAIWGMWYYICTGVLALAILLLRRQDTVAFARALVWLTVAALLFDAYLGWAMWWRLERFCPLCAVTYAINVVVLVIAGRCCWQLRDCPDRRLASLVPAGAILLRPHDAMYYREALKTFLVVSAGGASLVVLVLALIVSRAVVQKEKDKLASLLEYLRRVEPFYIPTERHPLRGPDEARITIVTFSDFLCEQCKLAGEYLDIVAANHRDSLRLVHVNYPVDTDCNEYAASDMHPGACIVARAAECAHRQGRFWEFHDVILREPGQPKPEKVTEYATRSGLDVDEFNACLADTLPTDQVRSDIALGHSVGVTAIPTSYINGRPVVGALKPRMLEAAIEAIAPLARPAPPTTTRASPAPSPGTDNYSTSP